MITSEKIQITTTIEGVKEKKKMKDFKMKFPIHQTRRQLINQIKNNSINKTNKI